MTASTVWQGRGGSVALGPTQHRVARYLDDLCRHGWIHVRTDELAERLGLERSEAFRILARLRTLGVFGISNDRGGHAGGRRVWRTATRHDGPRFDPARHRVAWARVRGASRRIRARAIAGLHHLRPAAARASQPPAPRGLPPAAPPRRFAELMRAGGLGALMDEWRIT